MRQPALLHALKRRLSPRPWAAFAAFPMLVDLVRLLMGYRPRLDEVPHFVWVFALSSGSVALLPIPWQWTGDDRHQAPLPRGLLQALACWGSAYGLARILGMPAPRHSHRALLALLAVLLLVGWVIAALQAAEAERQEALAARRTLEVTARQAQEQSLKAQLDPHVLYNALGGISELIRVDPDRAEAAVLSLADLYRTLTALGRRELVRLGEERALVQDYLAVEAVRLGARLKVSWDWPEALDAREVPPLLVQPLVENAIKHGLAPRKGPGELRISVAEDGAGLRFTVADDGAGPDPAWRQGTGLSNLAARLALLGGGSALDLRRAGAWTLAEIRFRPEAGVGGEA